MPYWRVRSHHSLSNITFFSGCLKCGGIIEPYHPERVLRQFGYVQTIPPPHYHLLKLGGVQVRHHIG